MHDYTHSTKGLTKIVYQESAVRISETVQHGGSRSYTYKNPHSVVHEQVPLNCL